MNRKQIVPPIILFGCIVFFWDVSCRIFAIDSYILPTPFSILQTLYTQLPSMIPHILTTFSIAVIGFFLSILLALILGCVLDTIVPLKKAFYPFFVVSQAVPIVFLYPLLMIWMGFGVEVKIIVVILVCFFPIIVNLLDGLASTDPELLDLFRSMDSGFLPVFAMVKLPGALPAFFSGLRIAATYSVMGAVIGEWLGAKKGMGVYMMRSYKTFSTVRVFASILVVIFLSLTVFYAVKFVERIVLRWKFIK